MMEIVVAIMLLLVFWVLIICLINISDMDKRIDAILAEEIRQNKRIDLLEKREQIRQSEERHDKAYIETKDLFKKW